MLLLTLAVKVRRCELEVHTYHWAVTVGIAVPSLTTVFNFSSEADRFGGDAVRVRLGKSA